MTDFKNAIFGVDTPSDVISDDVGETENESHNILIIDCNPIFREGLKACLSAGDENWSIFVSGDIDSGILEVDENNIGIVLLSTNQENLDIVEVVKNIGVSHGFLKIIITFHSVDEYARISEYVATGIKGAIEPNAAIETYSEAINSVSVGVNFNIDEILEEVSKDDEEKNIKNIDYSLTKREKEVLGLISSGLSNKEIAHYYTLSVRTVETHRQNIRYKTESNTLSDLIQVAAGLGIR